jgi:outer membrane murein-binding lipoprotein Lpp
MIGPAMAPPRRTPWTPILAAVAAFLLLTSVIMGVLFITRNSGYNQQKRTATERQHTIDSLNSDAQKLRDDLKKAEAERDAAKRDLGGAQGQADELTRQKQIISHCLNLLAEAGTAARNGDQATSAAKTKEADPICQEAFRYLN